MIYHKVWLCYDVIIRLWIAFKLNLPKSNLQKSDLSCRSIMPPKIHMALSCKTAECLWRGGGQSKAPPCDTRCQVSLAEKSVKTMIVLIYISLAARANRCTGKLLSRPLHLSANQTHSNIILPCPLNCSTDQIHLNTLTNKQADKLSILIYRDWSLYILRKSCLTVAFEFLSKETFLFSLKTFQRFLKASAILKELSLNFHLFHLRFCYKTYQRVDRETFFKANNILRIIRDLLFVHINPPLSQINKEYLIYFVSQRLPLESWYTKQYFCTMRLIQVFFFISLSLYFNNNVQFLSHSSWTYFKTGSHMVSHPHAFSFGKVITGYSHAVSLNTHMLSSPQNRTR